MVSRRKAIATAAGVVALPPALAVESALTKPVDNRNPLVPEQTIVGTGEGSSYNGPRPRGAAIGTYNQAQSTTGPVTSQAGKVQVFVVVINPTSPSGAWETVPASGAPATVTLPGDGSLIVTATDATANKYFQHGFAETIWQEYTVEGPLT